MKTKQSRKKLHPWRSPSISDQAIVAAFKGGMSRAMVVKAYKVPVDRVDAVLRQRA